ncbi:MAG: hypothetical protein GC165_04635 [Armatimonadetes bacterium]|nr:hypothetical protein [Armatimonadota bacterium]
MPTIFGSAKGLFGVHKQHAWRMAMTYFSKYSVPMLSAVWFVFAVAGFARMSAYSQTPAPVGTLSSQWPSQSKIQAACGMPTFLIFMHPHCPCSDASFDVVKDQIAKHPKAKFYAVFVRPAGVEAKWEETRLYQNCKAEPRLTTLVDQDGVEAKQFGAKTSGQAFIYSATGQLVYSGGVTPGRGATWTGRERELIENALNGATSLQKAPVFGCSLL